MLKKEDLDQLNHTTNDESKKVFSLYLNVDPRDAEQEGDKWKVKFKKD